MRSHFLLLPILIALSSTPAMACEFTDEYNSLRMKVYRLVKEPYERCNDSVSNYFYWQEYVDCEARELGKNVAGGCAHIAEYKVGNKTIGKDEHCEILKPTREEHEAYLEQAVREENVKVCVDAEAESQADQ